MESLARLGHPCPDYFQIASIQKLDYYFHCLPSLNGSHDIHLPLHLMDDFLAVAPQSAEHLGGSAASCWPIR